MNWGTRGRAVMPGQGRAVEQACKGWKRSDLSVAHGTLGETIYYVHLNDRAYRWNVPANVWNCRVGGYQVLKNRQSYREWPVLGWGVSVKKVGYFSEVARRIGALLQLTGVTATAGDRTVMYGTSPGYEEPHAV